MVKVLLPEGSERPPGDSVSPWEDHPGWVIEEGGDDFDLPGLLEEEEAAAWLFDCCFRGRAVGCGACFFTADLLGSSDATSGGETKQKTNNKSTAGLLSLPVYGR